MYMKAGGEGPISIYGYTSRNFLGINVSVFIILLLVSGSGWYIVRFRPSEKLKVISYLSNLGRRNLGKVLLT